MPIVVPEDYPKMPIVVPDDYPQHGATGKGNLVPGSISSNKGYGTV